MCKDDQTETRNDLECLIDAALTQRRQETTDVLVQLLKKASTPEHIPIGDAAKKIALKLRRYRPHNEKRMNEAYEAARTLRLMYRTIWKQPGSAKQISHETGIPLSRVYRYFKLSP